MRWKESIIGDHIELAYGDGLPERDRKGGKYPVYGSNGVVGSHDRALVRGPGIIIGRKGTVGQVTLSKSDFWPIDTTYYVKLKEDGDIFFWFYLLQTLGLSQMNSHSAVPGLNRDNVYSILKQIPPPTEQRAIAKILSDLDEKIEFNNQMNKTLEMIGHAVFKQWFVDFEFPDRNGKPYKSSGGKKIDSELGEIPEGWAVKEISDCGEVVCGKTPPTADKDNYGDDIFFITIPDMRGQAFVIKTERRLSKKGATTQKKKELPSLAICVSCIATPGLVSLTSGLSHTNQQINSIVCNKDTSPFFMYYKMLDKSEEIKSMGLGGTATLNLNTGNFARIKVVVPEKAIMDSFHKTVMPFMERILSNSIENDGLCSIRDSLLPRLMSGQIRIGNPHEGRF